MTTKALLPLYQDRADRAERDRLELLTALINGPSFDPVFRPEVIRIPRGHPVYRWECMVEHCERTRAGGTDLCSAHREQWCAARDAGRGQGSVPDQRRAAETVRTGRGGSMPGMPPPARGVHPVAPVPAA